MDGDDPASLIFGLMIIAGFVILIILHH